MFSLGAPEEGPPGGYEDQSQSKMEKCFEWMIIIISW